MPSHEKQHFDSYSAQTQAKHGVLTAYLPSYLQALKKQADRFHYIDGFAGRGSYSKHAPGSPLLALRVISEASVASRTTISLVEATPEFHAELVRMIADDPAASELREAPLVLSGRFDEHIDEILKTPTYREGGRVATFTFVDPCGVSGVRMADLARLLQLDFGEVLLLFNYDGVNRILGGVEAKTQSAEVLLDLLGARHFVTELLTSVQSTPASIDREQQVRECFVRALQAHAPVKYLVPFRFEAKQTARTSHYLLHCSNSPLAFKMMKHVMWEAGRDETNPYGRLEFLNDRERGQQFELFHHDIDQKKKEILEHLRHGPTRAATFTRDWACKPTDLFSEKVYRTMLLELETHGLIRVFDKQNQEPAPKRPRRKGESTLGRDYWLRLP